MDQNGSRRSGDQCSDSGYISRQSQHDFLMDQVVDARDKEGPDLPLSVGVAYANGRAEMPSAEMGLARAGGGLDTPLWT